MIIVSQDKDTIINCERMNFIKIEDLGSIVVNYADDYNELLGVYDTQERAGEVLKEIVEAIKGKSQITMTQEELITEAYGGYYEMPED